MANAATLSVSIFARTSQFRKGLRSVERDLRTFGSRASIAVSAVATSLGFLAARQAEVISQSARVASRLGLTTDTLIALREVGDEAGISAENLDRALQIMAKNTAGMGGSTLENLLKIAKHLNGVSDASTRLAEAQKIFGKQGFEMLNIISRLPQKLIEARAETTAFGTAVSDLDAQSVIEARNAWGDVKDILSGVGTQIAVQASGVVKALAEQLTSAATAGSSVGDKVAAGLDKITAAVGAAGDSVNALISLWHAFKGVVQTAGGVVASVVDALTFGKLGFADALATDMFKAASESKGKMADAMAGAVDQSFSKSLQKFVQDANTEIKKVASETLSDSRLEEITARTDRRRMPKPHKSVGAEFMQIDLSRMLVGGAAAGTRKREQQVHDPQLETTNKLLGRILHAGAGGGIVE